MKTSVFALLTLILCLAAAMAQDSGSQSQTRPLTYEQVLERWDRSRSYGDPRDLRTFSQDMVTRRQTGDETDDFSQGLRDGPWIRFYARSDQIFSGATGLVIIGALVAILLAVLFTPHPFLFPRFSRVLAINGNERGGHPIHEVLPASASITDSTPTSTEAEEEDSADHSVRRWSRNNDGYLQGMSARAVGATAGRTRQHNDHSLDAYRPRRASASLRGRGDSQ